MNSLIQKDFYRYGITKTRILGILSALKIPGAIFMYFHRIASENKKYSILGVLSRIILRHLTYKFGFQIPANVKIGEGFYIGHFGTIVISPQAIIGKNCNIAHGVTIGRISNGKRKGAPEIGNFVWIGTNSIIVGNIKIGDNVLIAPGAYVNFNVPDNSLVIGNPGQIIPKENPTDGYINHVLD